MPRARFRVVEARPKALLEKLGAQVTPMGMLEIYTALSRGTVDGYDRLPSSTTATMFYRFNGGAVSQVSLVGLPYGIPGTSNGQASQIQVAPSITPPAGATNVELWFQSAKASTSCTNWDSNFGSNYNFGVTP